MSDPKGEPHWTLALLPVPGWVIEVARRLPPDLPTLWEKGRDLLADIARESSKFAKPWDASVAKEFEDIYRNKVEELAGGYGCMLAMYRGLEALYPDHPKYFSGDKDGSIFRDAYNWKKKEGLENNCDTTFQYLHTKGLAGDAVESRRDANGKWVPPAEETVRGMMNKYSHGWYFFGLSADEAGGPGNHTVVLAVDYTGQEPKIFWMDQYANNRGFLATNEVTGKLDTHLVDKDRDVIRIYPLRPEEKP